MGWSCKTAASRTLQRIETACKASHGRVPHSNNVFLWKGHVYFYEEVRVDQEDGGICGEVYVDLGGKAREVCKFRIDGVGRVVDGPQFFKQAGRLPGA